MVNFRRFYRFDTTSTEVFKELKDKYYGIVVSAHILSYTPTSVIQLLNAVDKPFFIDPFTHVFARDIDIIRSTKGKKKGIKNSFKKLMDDYGVPFSNCKTGKAFAPTMFKQVSSFDDTLIDTCCKIVLDFQRTKCKVTTSFPKYEKLLKREQLPQSVYPSFLVAPYFYIDKYSSDWYAITERFAKRSLLFKGNDKLYAVICISTNMLYNTTNLDKMVTDYDGFDGYLIWINNLDEENITTDELEGLRRLIKKLVEYGKPVHSLYGGFLMDLLAKFGLTGYSSGICYGETRNVDSRGGGAGVRHYVPTIHIKISAGIANEFFALSNKNLQLLCSCDVCSAIRSKIPKSLSAKDYTDRFFTNMSFLDHRRHFVTVKYDEIAFIENNGETSIDKKLQKEIGDIDDADPIPKDPPPELKSKHLKVWRKLFQSMTP